MYDDPDQINANHDYEVETDACYSEDSEVEDQGNREDEHQERRVDDLSTGDHTYMHLSHVACHIFDDGVYIDELS